MGRLTYGNILDISFDDRTLQHLEAVISIKLSHNESFLFTWQNEAESDPGRNVIWINSGIPLSYKFTSSRSPQLNPKWTETLLHSANSPDGLLITPEPPTCPSRTQARSFTDLWAKNLTQPKLLGCAYY